MLLAIGSLTVIGAALGALLGVAARCLAVAPVSAQSELLGLLPGFHCGLCGFVGCDQAAAALAAGKAPPTLCRSGGAAVARMLADRLGSHAPSALAFSGALTPDDALADGWAIEDDTITVAAPTVAAPLCQSCRGSAVSGRPVRSDHRRRHGRPPIHGRRR